MSHDSRCRQRAKPIDIDTPLNSAKAGDIEDHMVDYAERTKIELLAGLGDMRVVGWSERRQIST
jgi:hypothetical protein